MRHRIAVFIARWRTEYSVVEVLIYLVVLFPVSYLLFPNNSLWMVMVLLFVQFLDALKDLADQLADETPDPKRERTKAQNRRNRPRSHRGRLRL